MLKYVMLMTHKPILAVFFFVTLVVFPQESSVRPYDTLLGKSYDALYQKIRNPELDRVTRKTYLKEYLDKSQAQDSLEKIIQGYKNYLLFAPRDIRLVYGDSMIASAKKTKDPVHIGSAYLTMGIAFYRLKKYRKALDHYLVANQYLIKTGDDYLKNKLKFNMALVKHDTRYYNEAIVLLKECADYFKQDSLEHRPYLNTLYLLSRCHTRMENYGLSSEIIGLGIAEGRRRKDISREAYFTQTEGMNLCLTANYAQAIPKLKGSLKKIRKKKDDFANVVLGNFYLGKSYWGVGEREKAVRFFEKVDSSFTAWDYTKWEYLEGYTLLERYYRSTHNLELEHHYLERHIHALEFMDRQQQDLAKKFKKEYDIKGVLQEKAKVEMLLQAKAKREILWIASGGLLCLLVVGLIYREYRIKRIYKQRFDAFIKGQRPREKKKKAIPLQNLNIPRETVDKVLKQLDVFEKNKKFLDKEVSAGKLPAILGVNSKYLSLIVAFYKEERKVVEYLNDLRIDYIIDLFEKDPRVLHYSNKSLAGDAGFNSERAFSDAFKSRTDISPKFFIQELKKKKQT